MDFRLLLLLHTPIGLKLEPVDVECLFAENLDVHDPVAVVEAIQTDRAREYLRCHPEWRETAMKTLESGRSRGVRWSQLCDSDYPRQWLSLSTFPLAFSYLGDPVWQSRPAIAIVGSRTPSTETLRWMQKELPRFFHMAKPVVVSGGARGVDQWAHRLAMDCGCPTVCVLPSGILNPYPYERDDLWERVISTGGALISTCAPHEPLRKGFFQIRNRWICGMSPLCFVVEANRRSGSAMTAKFANDEHRQVCTLPVFPTASQGLGNLDLLFDGGAVLVRDGLDLATLWGGSP